MKYLIVAVVLGFCLAACEKKLQPESKAAEKIETAATPLPAPNPVPPYQWASLPVYEMPGYPFNSPNYKNIVMNVNNNIYLLTASLYERCYKLNNNTKQWSPVPSFGLFGVGFQYLFCYADKVYSGLVPGQEFNSTFFYSVNPETGATQTLATYPGTATGNQLCFVLGDKGYVISGFTATTLPQVWEYNFATNQWTNKGNSPLGRRYDACVFVANNKVYMGMGYDYISLNGQNIKRYKRDWLQYTPGSAYAAVMADFPGTARSMAKGFVINNMPHVGFGNNSSSYFTDMWKYNPSANTWTQQPDWPTVPYIVDYNIGTFSLGTTGYLVTGALAKFWRYSNSIFYP
jgi:N-acetylneuraminic acid mutarotase